jgi:hypothetical protein
MDSYHFIKIDYMEHTGFEMYYKKPVNRGIDKTNIFNDKYIYYLKIADSEEFKLIGKFIGLGKISSCSPYHDYDYDVYNFDMEQILCSKKHLIYCSGIPDSEENMVIIQNITYQGYEVYYKNL